MTIKEAISRCDTVKPNQYSEAEKMQWLTELDSRIFTEIISTHEKPAITEFVPYTNPETVLIAGLPYEAVYVYYLCSKIDFFNAEFSRYNNSVSMFNTAYSDYADYYNRTHMPYQKNSIQI